MTEYKKQYSYEEVVEKIENSRRFGKLPGVEVTRCMLAVLQEPHRACLISMWQERMEKARPVLF